MERPSPSARRVLSFEIGARMFAVEANAVLEVATTPAVTRVPRAPAALRGLANLRGQIIPVLSLAQTWEDAGGTPGARLVVLAGETPVALAVDRIGSIVEASAEADVDADGADADHIEIAQGRAELLRLEDLLNQTFPKMAAPAAARAAPSAVVARSEVVAEVAILEFRVAGQVFGLRLTEVREVCAAPEEWLVLPGAEAALSGVMAWRGGVLPVASCASLLGLDPHPPGPLSRIVVISLGDHEVGLLVDEILGLVRAPAGRMSLAPALFNRGRGEAKVDAILRLDERLISVLAAGRLLDSSRFDALATAPHDAGAGEPAEASLARRRLLLFRLGAEAYGLPLEQVEAVTRLPDVVASVPNAPPFVLGVIHHRGRVLPLIDQAQSFGREAHAGARRQVIIARSGGKSAGFVVDAVDEVALVEERQLQATPPLALGGSAVFDRVAQLDHHGRPILVVDLRNLLDQTERDLASAFAKDAAGS